MKITFYRADGRDMTALAIVQPRVPPDTTAIVSHLQNPKQTSEDIRNAGQATFWISACLDQECRGQTKGNKVYKFTIDDLEVYKIPSKLTATTTLESVGLQAAVGGVNAMLKTWMPNKAPHLVMDGKSIAGSNVIALLHCQSGDSGGGANGIDGSAEVSFFTKITDKIDKL